MESLKLPEFELFFFAQNGFKKNRNLLHVACMKGLVEVTKFLIEKLPKDKSVDFKDFNGFTPLIFAVIKGNS